MRVAKSLLKLEMMNTEGNDYKLLERYVGEQALMTRPKLSQMFQGRIVQDSKMLELLFVFDIKFHLFNIIGQNSLKLKRFKIVFKVRDKISLKSMQTLPLIELCYILN